MINITVQSSPAKTKGDRLLHPTPNTPYIKSVRALRINRDIFFGNQHISLLKNDIIYSDFTNRLEDCDQCLPESLVGT